MKSRANNFVRLTTRPAGGDYFEKEMPALPRDGIVGSARVRQLLSAGQRPLRFRHSQRSQPHSQDRYRARPNCGGSGMRHLRIGWSGLLDGLQTWSGIPAIFGEGVESQQSPNERQSLEKSSRIRGLTAIILDGSPRFGRKSSPSAPPPS